MGEGKALAWVRVTLEYPIECEPSYLEMTHDEDIGGDVTHETWHRSQGTWCADNIIDELERAQEMIRQQTSFRSLNSAINAGSFNRGCLCDIVERRPGVAEVTVNAERTPEPPWPKRKKPPWWRTCLGRWQWRLHYRQWGPVNWDPERKGKPHFWEGDWKWGK